jgi:hypothetical protein
MNNPLYYFDPSGYNSLDMGSLYKNIKIAYSKIQAHVTNKIVSGALSGFFGYGAGICLASGVMPLIFDDVRFGTREWWNKSIENFGKTFNAFELGLAVISGAFLGKIEQLLQTEHVWDVYKRFLQKPGIYNMQLGTVLRLAQLATERMFREQVLLAMKYLPWVTSISACSNGLALVQQGIEAGTEATTDILIALSTAALSGGANAGVTILIGLLPEKITSINIFGLDASILVGVAVDSCIGALGILADSYFEF